MNISTDQKATPWMPAAQKAAPPSAAWTRPTTSVPLMVARETERNRSASRRLSTSGSGR